MSGLGMLLNTAKSAIAAHQIGMNVTGNNIANVNNPTYSRRTALYSSKMPVQIGRFIFGTGVDIQQIRRSCNQLIENRLSGQKSSLSANAEMSAYMNILETSFNENSEAGLSTQMSGFWNLWQDLSNNPAGSSERSGLYEKGVLLSDQFDSLDADLTQIKVDINKDIEAAAHKINSLTSDIAAINGEIVALETGGDANDLRDRRNALVAELSEIIDIQTFEQTNGEISVSTGNGYLLVNHTDAYSLKISEGRVEYLSSNGGSIDITDGIDGGKIGGLFNMRDEVVPKYQAELNELAKQFIWSVNLQHSKGIGLEYFSSSVTGTYSVSDPDTALNSAGPPVNLSYGDNIESGNFTLWIQNDSTSAKTAVNINIDPDTITLNEFAAAIDAASGISAFVNGDSELVLNADDGFSFSFSDDTGIAAALGINTFFEGDDAETIRVNSLLKNTDYIAAAKLDENGEFAAGDNSNALSIADLQYQTQNISQWTFERGGGADSTNLSISFEDFYHSMLGSMGIKSANISSSVEFNEVMAAKLGEQRDAVSAVSLDEEMVNMMKYQHAFTAASRLLNVADEMLNTLIELR